MSKFLNPWVLIGFMLALAGAVGVGVKIGSDHQIAKQADAKELIAEAADAFDERSAKRIAQLRPIHQTIQGQIKEITHEKTVYRDCVADPVVERLLDSARANHAATAAGNGIVP